MKYGRDFAIYFFVNALNSGVPILLLPFLSKNLSTAEFGTYYLVASIVNILTPLIGLSVHGSIQTYYAKLTFLNFKCFLSNVVLVFLANSALIAFVAVLFLDTWSLALNLERHYVLAAVGIALFQYVTTIAITFLQASRSAIRFLFLQSCNLLANLSLTVLFVFTMNNKLTGRITGWVAAAGFGALISTFCLLKCPGIMRGGLDLRYVKSILTFALPLIPHTVGGLAVALSDRWVIAAIVGKAELGAYSISQQITSILGLLLSSAVTVYNPWLFSALRTNTNEMNQKIVARTYLILILICVGVPLFWRASSWLLPKLTDRKFHGALEFLPYHTLAAGFNGMFYFISGYFFYTEKTLYLACITISIGVFQVLACIVFVSVIGALGAAIAQSVAFLLLFAICFYVGNRVFPMPWLRPRFA